MIPNLFERVIAVLGSFGVLINCVLLTCVVDETRLPLGFPPQAEEHAVDQAAPEQCLFLLSWAGSAESDPKSSSKIEKLLAEDEIQQSLKSLIAAFQKNVEMAFEGEPEGRIVSKWLSRLWSRPGMIFLEDIELDGGGDPKITGGAVINLQEDATELAPVLQRLLRKIPDDALEDVEIDGRDFTRLQIERDAPPLIFGIVDEYLIAGTTEQTVKRLMGVKKAKRPDWLEQVIKNAKVPQRSITFYLNASRVGELMYAAMGDAVGPLQIMGLDDIDSYAMVSGFDEEGYLSRGSLNAKQGKLLAGMFSLLGDQPVTPASFAQVPADATLAVAGSFSIANLLDSIRGRLQEHAPGEVDNFDRGLESFGKELGLSFEKEILPAFGERAVIYHSKSEGGLLTGFSAIVEIRHRAVLEKIVETFVAEIVPPDEDFGFFATRHFQTEWQGVTIHSLSNVNEFSPFVLPSICVTDDALIIAMMPQNIKAILSRAKDFQSLADSPELKKSLTDGAAVVVYSDSAEFMRAMYPVVQFGLQFMLQEFDLQGFDSGVLPSGELLAQYLGKDTSIVRRGESGFEFTTRASLPGVDYAAVATAVIGLAATGIDVDDLGRTFSMFSPGRGREIASINNLRQIALGMHNYHDVYKKFPAAVNADEDGKPLLSWRVHILPYMEEQVLYDQFHLDEPWDSEHNKALIEKMPRVYLAPGSEAGVGKTNYLTVRGAGTPFPGDKGLSMATIRDGTSNTIMAVEASDAKAVIWTKPDDFKPDGMKPLAGLLGLRRGGFLVALCDGSTMKIEDSIEADQWEALISRAGGEVIDEFELRSPHEQRTVPRAIRRRGEGKALPGPVEPQFKDTQVEEDQPEKPRFEE